MFIIGLRRDETFLHVVGLKWLGFYLTCAYFISLVHITLNIVQFFTCYFEKQYKIGMGSWHVLWRDMLNHFKLFFLLLI